MEEYKPTDYEKIKISALWDSLKRFDGYISTVNFKSGLLATFNSAIFAGVILKSSEILASVNGGVKILLLCGLVAISLISLLSIFWVIKSIWPNLSSSSSDSVNKEHSVLFFASIAKNYKAQEYIDKIKYISFQDFESDLSRQVHEVAVITSDKMRKISIASRIAVVNLVLLGFLAFVFIYEISGIKICQG
ncbi:Pycsar system effector family protein [Pseudomonas sp. WHRI 8822A]|uniref:Pycsar system effector family protein n=1 Tax=Pseudomonas sp. WHRI 8822A TaxID=3162568 RepID=UPI0032EAC9A6